MLINKLKYNENDIVTFKLTIGDEIIAKLISEHATHFVITNPLGLVPGQGGGLGLMQEVMSVKPDTPFELNRDHVLFHGETNGQLSAHYIEVTTGISTPPKKSIVLA